MKLKTLVLKLFRKRKVRSKNAVITEGHTFPLQDLDQEPMEQNEETKEYKPFTYSDPRYDLLMTSLRYTMGISNMPRARNSESRQPESTKPEVNDHTQAMTADVMNNFVSVVDEMKRAHSKTADKTQNASRDDNTVIQEKTAPIQKQIIHSQDNYISTLDDKASIYHHAVQNVESFHSAMIEQPKLHRFYKPRRLKKFKSKRETTENNDYPKPTDDLSTVTHQRSLSQRLESIEKSIRNVSLNDEEEEPNEKWTENSVVNANGNNGNCQKTVRFQDAEYELEYASPDLMKKMREKGSVLKVPLTIEIESTTERVMVWTVRKM